MWNRFSGFFCSHWNLSAATNRNGIENLLGIYMMKCPTKVNSLHGNSPASIKGSELCVSEHKFTIFDLFEPETIKFISIYINEYENPYTCNLFWMLSFVRSQNFIYWYHFQWNRLGERFLGFMMIKASKILCYFLLWNYRINSLIALLIDFDGIVFVHISRPIMNRGGERALFLLFICVILFLLNLAY